ncbi:hypothetical protein [Companilactobacillus mishanensis]|uniref:DUF916 domain-containing protein n=1 Tax=Companilactobacillus mishanensis TaxID=2486008 RepID=A0A5P0ZEJ4_9LACO|nr:hypothetical protein [Companilactobacillus mishanensis]MQS44448.1 hypothetical protein [Companilactobacillus mishanensis]MQS51448.1 hypothetical protein [Companilactobacillus mishanensis]MQS88691.1 hypothetical protein [Companilactobacillus mishanensis]
MEITLLIIKIILTVAIITGVVLITIPLFRLNNYLKEINRPYFVVNKVDESTFTIKNTGRSNAEIAEIFLNPDYKYVEEFNGVNFVPGQSANFTIVPDENKKIETVEISYIDKLLKKPYRQKIEFSSIAK